jgi:putative flippase GtrA
MVPPGSEAASKQPGRLVSFAVVGGIGFLVDAAVLTLMVNGLGWGPYSARLLSFAVAVTVTWYLNRRWTFASHASVRKKAEYARYFTVQSAGALLNLGIYGLCLETYPLMAAYPVLALAIGSAVALFFNFFAAKYLVFTQRRLSF